MGTDDNGVHVNAAVICDRVLKEEDGVFSLIRVIDYISASIPKGVPAASLVFTPATIHIFVSLKSYRHSGESEIEVSFTGPGSLSPSSKGSAHGNFTPGSTLVFTDEFKLPMDSPGIIWIELRLDGALLTRFPFEIRHTPEDDDLNPSGSEGDTVHHLFPLSQNE